MQGSRRITIPQPPDPGWVRLLHRFLDHIIEEKAPPHCWLWKGAVNNYGYPLFGIGRSHAILAHRVSHVLFIGEIPPGHQVDHLCRRKRCVLPSHLEAVTPAENNRRSTSLTSQNRKKWMCVNGHPFDRSNTRVTAAGHRRCLTCDRANKRRWAAKRRVR